MKKLYKSDKDKVISGVLGGLGEYFEMDPTLLRLAFIVLVVLTGVFPGIIGYILAALVVPNHPGVKDTPFTETPKSDPEPVKTEPSSEEKS